MRNLFMIIFVIGIFCPLPLFAECLGCEDCPDTIKKVDYYHQKVEYVVNHTISANNKDELYYKKGDAFYYGCGVKRNYQTALGFYERAFSYGNEKARLKYAKMLLTGLGGEKNLIRAYDLLANDRSEKKEGFYNLAVMYLSGYGVEKSYKLAEFYLTKAKEENNKKASRLLNEISFESFINKQKTAKMELEKAKFGEPIAIYNSAYNYLYGEGFSKDIKQALYWFSRASLEGVSCAYGNIGDIYFKGEAVKENRKLGLNYWKKAIRSGCFEYAYYLGRRYYYGDGLEKSLVKSKHYLDMCKEADNRCEELIKKIDKSFQQ